MHKYLPHSESEIKAMLETIKVPTLDSLFCDVPQSIMQSQPLAIGQALPEQQLIEYFDALAKKNANKICFLGGGVYDHYVPSVIATLVSREEFSTAYTPYQPEISQGTLQYIFEFQSMIVELTGLDVANASLYDGGTSCAEAMLLAVSQTRKNRIAVASSINPVLLEILKTYAKYRDIEIVEIKLDKGRTSLSHFATLNDGSLAGVIVSTPNFYGLNEDPSELFRLIHEKQGLAIVHVNPLTLGVLKTPAEMEADIATGDGQSLGIPLSFGGPYLGFMAVKKAYMRKMPGRIVGASVDSEGKRAYVLTLQAREQHIRREKATSNICSNQSLMALWVTIYLSLLGQVGLVETCKHNIALSHYCYQQLLNTHKFKPVYDTDFFNEFVVETSLDLKLIDQALHLAGFTSGLHLQDKRIMFAVTEARSKQQIDRFVKVLGGLSDE